MASIAKYIYTAAGEPKVYYGEVPEDFVVPSVLFPASEDIEQRGDTLDAYAFDFSWPIKFFHSTTRNAMEQGKAAMSALSADRNLVPIIKLSGEQEGYGLRIKMTTLTAVDTGAALLTLLWSSVRPYNRADMMYAQEFVAYIGGLTTEFGV